MALIQILVHITALSNEHTTLKESTMASFQPTRSREHIRSKRSEVSPDMRNIRIVSLTKLNKPRLVC